jgi:hypothetical protein
VGLVIEVDQLVKRFGAVTAVDGLSFTVRPGHVTGFLGPNGAGRLPGPHRRERRLPRRQPGRPRNQPGRGTGPMTAIDARPDPATPALHPATNLFAPAWSLLVLLAWPAVTLLVAALMITRRDA